MRRHFRRRVRSCKRPAHVRRGIPHVWLLPCLFFTLMLGPIGLLLYLALRYARLRVTTLDESTAA